MSKTRASIFEDEDTGTLDVASFTPKTVVGKAPPVEQIRAVAEAANFKSREPASEKAPQADKQKRPPRQYRTGRNVQFNVKALAETVNEFYAITDKQGWVLGYTLQRAVEALQRELKQSQ